MSGYTFYFSNPNRNVPDFDFAECADDGEAAVVARRQLDQRMTAQAVEIFNGESVVARIEREGRRPLERPEFS